MWRRYAAAGGLANHGAADNGAGASRAGMSAVQALGLVQCSRSDVAGDTAAVTAAAAASQQQVHMMMPQQVDCTQQYVQLSVSHLGSPQVQYSAPPQFYLCSGQEAQMHMSGMPMEVASCPMSQMSAPALPPAQMPAQASGMQNTQQQSFDSASHLSMLMPGTFNNAGVLSDAQAADIAEQLRAAAQCTYED
jgi:hypothetical protein